jgi:hypothetical protein
MNLYEKQRTTWGMAVIFSVAFVLCGMFATLPGRGGVVFLHVKSCPFCGFRDDLVGLACLAGSPGRVVCILL